MAASSEGRETREQLLEAAAGAGHPISGSQLARFHRAGLLPRPVVRALGRGRGTVSLYPPGTTERLLDVVRIHSSEHRLRDVAWRLWWLRGGPLPELAAELLARQAARLDAQREEFVELLVGEDAGDEDRIDALYAQSPALHGQACRRRGRPRRTATEPAPRGAPDRSALVDWVAERHAARTRRLLQTPAEMLRPAEQHQVTDLQAGILAATQELHRKGHPAGQP
jgi:hypothetical protein